MEIDDGAVVDYVHADRHRFLKQCLINATITYCNYECLYNYAADLGGSIL